MCQTVRMPVPHIELKIRNKLTTQLLTLSRESGVETSINRPDLIELYQPASKQSSKQASKQMIKNPLLAFHRLFFGGHRIAKFC